MKILTDFDGVLTDPSQEGVVILEAYQDLLSRAGISAKTLTLKLEQARQTFQQNPTQYGWMSQNRVSAYWNEDPFIFLNAYSYFLDTLRDQDPDLECDLDSFQSVVAQCFESIEKIQPLESDALEILLELQDKGHDVTIVSNSHPERIMRILGEDSKRMKVRGSAQKYELGEAQNSFLAGQYSVDINRPFYKAILDEIQPDLVIGDVFSLDLSLPLQMNKISHVMIRKRPYTPEWSLKALVSYREGKVLNHFSEIPEIL